MKRERATGGTAPVCCSREVLGSYVCMAESYVDFRLFKCSGSPFATNIQLPLKETALAIGQIERKVALSSRYQGQVRT